MKRQFRFILNFRLMKHIVSNTLKIMKRTFITVTMAILSVVAFGQTCFKDGTVWKTKVFYDADPSVDLVEISKLDGTETVGGYEAMKMYCEYENKPDSKYLAYYVRTDKDKVYFMPAINDSKTWYLMYDFGMVPGQGCYMYCPPYGNQEPYKAYIKCIGISKGESSAYSVMEMEDYKDETCDEQTKGEGKWFKGISSYIGVNYNIGFGLDGRGGTLLEVRNGDEVFYMQTPTSVSQVSKSSVEYRLDGQELNVSNIKDGKKVSVYSIDGKLLGTFKPKGNNVNVYLSKDGLYILKVGELKQKILVQSSDK